MKPIYMYLAHDKRSNLVWGYFGYEGKLYEWLGKWCPEDTPAALHVNWVVHDDRGKLYELERDAVFNQVSLKEMEKRVPGFEEMLMKSFIFNHHLSNQIPNEKEFEK